MPRVVDDDPLKPIRLVVIDSSRERPNLNSLLNGIKEQAAPVSTKACVDF